MSRNFITLVMVIFLVIKVTEGASFCKICCSSKKKSVIKKKEDISISEIVSKNTIKFMIYDYLNNNDIYKFSRSYATIESDQVLSKQIENLHQDLAVAARMYWVFPTTKFLYSHWRWFLMNESTIKMDDADLVYQINKFVKFDDHRVRFTESFLSLYKLMLYVQNIHSEDPRKAAAFFQQYQNQFWCVCPHHPLPLSEPANYTLANIPVPSRGKIKAVGYCMYSATLRFLLASKNNKNSIMDFAIETIPVNIGITLRDPSVTPKTNTKLFFSFLLNTFPPFYGPFIEFQERTDGKWILFAIYDRSRRFPLLLHCQTDGKNRVQSYFFKLVSPDSLTFVDPMHYDIHKFW